MCNKWRIQAAFGRYNCARNYYIRKKLKKRIRYKQNKIVDKSNIHPKRFNRFKT